MPLPVQVYLIPHYQICSCRGLFIYLFIFWPQSNPWSWNSATRCSCMLSAEESFQPWETVWRAADERFKQHTLFPVKDGECICRVLQENKGWKQIERRYKRLHFEWFNKSRKPSTATCFVTVLHTCPRPSGLAPPSPDGKGEDHYLLGVVERDAMTLPFGLLIHHCHACFCFPPRNARTDINKQTQQRWTAQACQQGDIPIHTGLIMSLASTIWHPKPKNVSNRN